jgi:hypothetical protein
MREMGYKPYLGETRCFDSREVDQKSEGTRILGVKTKEMSILEYEWKFHDLSLFALHHIPTKERMIKKLRNGLR